MAGACVTVLLFANGACNSSNAYADCWQWCLSMTTAYVNGLQWLAGIAY
jgi:hypothetical protein